LLRDKTERAGAGPGRWCGCEATARLTGGAGLRWAGMSEMLRPAGTTSGERLNPTAAGGDDAGRNLSREVDVVVRSNLLQLITGGRLNH
jgi:hypothetical protein